MDRPARLSDVDQKVLQIDWRRHRRHGVLPRRPPRTRWVSQRRRQHPTEAASVASISDEVDADAVDPRPSGSSDSALLSALRSCAHGRMHDIVATIQASRTASSAPT